MKPTLNNNKWVHLELERTLPLHALWILWVLILNFPALLSACQGSGAGADIMEGVAFIGRDNDVRAAVSSPDIQVRLCLLSVRCRRPYTPEADLIVLVKKCVCVCMDKQVHMYLHTYTSAHTECKVKLIWVTWPEPNMARRCRVKEILPASEIYCPSTMHFYRLSHPPVVLKNVFSPVWYLVSQASDFKSYVSLTVTVDGVEPRKSFLGVFTLTLFGMKNKRQD